MQYLSEMKKTLLFSITFFSVVASMAQSISPEVIASAGGSDNIQLNWTLGEVMIDTYDSGNNILTQGFHQTLLVLPPDPVNVTNLNEIDVNIFPNPTSDRIIIEVNKNDNALSIELIDMNGKLIVSDIMQPGMMRKELNVSKLATSYYLLKMFSIEGEFSSTYKIQKANK
jgi:hypothetical protein